MSTDSDFHDATEDFGRRWNRFWFTPAEALPCSVLRIAVGLLAVAHFLAMGPRLGVWFANDGALTSAAVKRILELPGGGGATFHPSYLNYFSAGTGLYVVHAAAVIVSLAFAFGFLTRASGVLTLVALLAYVHRVPEVAGDVEPVLSFMIAYLVIAPSGALLSVDQRLFGSSKKSSIGLLLAGSAEPSLAANISLRLIQVHVAMFYAMMGLSKLYGDAWWQGGAVWMVLAQTESRVIDATVFRRMGQIGEYLLNFAAHLIVYFELAFGILIWTRIGRPVLLALSLIVWPIIILATGQLLFGLAMLAANLAFVSPAWLHSLIGRSATENHSALPLESAASA
ncbi:MAG TPA: hypothetical protein VGI40_22490 [Pirellulaceae bacterium]|jgi:hypothetical protein